MLFMIVAILILMGLADASVHFPDGPCFGGIAANPGISRGRALPGVWAGLGKFRDFTPTEERTEGWRNRYGVPGRLWENEQLYPRNPTRAS